MQQGAVLVAAILVLLVIRLVYLISSRGRRKRGGQRSNACRTLVVLGSGGHTAEMLSLLSGMDLNHYHPRVYVAAEGDTMSVKKAEAFEEARRHHSDAAAAARTAHVRRIPRARKVLQSYLSSVFTTIYSLLYSVPLVCSEWPDLLLCNGPGTCIPLCAVAFILKFFFLRDVGIVYVESICRVQALSLSGKLLYYFADHVVVQWPELKNKYPRTTYLGRIL